jgi:hypothetical protein
MGKSIKGTTKKRRGRPTTTGKGTQIGMRWQEPQLSAIDSWMDKNEVGTRPEAIRRLVELGLSVKPALRPSAKAAARAAELAAKVIDWHIDPTAPIEEREVRKQRLLKGPPVFRDLRKDLAK